MQRGEGILNPAHLGHLRLLVVVDETDGRLALAIRPHSLLGLVVPLVRAQELDWIHWDLYPP